MFSNNIFATTPTFPSLGGFHWVGCPGTSVESVENVGHLAILQLERERVTPWFGWSWASLSSLTAGAIAWKVGGPRFDSRLVLVVIFSLSPVVCQFILPSPRVFSIMWMLRFERSWLGRHNQGKNSSTPVTSDLSKTFHQICLWLHQLVKTKKEYRRQCNLFARQLAARRRWLANTDKQTGYHSNV